MQFGDMLKYNWWNDVGRCMTQQLRTGLERLSIASGLEVECKADEGWSKFAHNYPASVRCRRHRIVRKRGMKDRPIWSRLGKPVEVRNLEAVVKDVSFREPDSESKPFLDRGESRLVLDGRQIQYRNRVTEIHVEMEMPRPIW